MSQRKTEIKKIHQPNTIIRNKEYYFNTLDLEHDLLKKASDLAERMMTAFMRENKVQVSIDVDDIANKIIEKILEKTPNIVYASNQESSHSNQGGFSYNDEPVIFETESIKIKNNTKNVVKTGDSISENLDILENLKI